MLDLEKIYDIQPVLKPMEYEEIRNLMEFKLNATAPKDCKPSPVKTTKIENDFEDPIEVMECDEV